MKIEKFGVYCLSILVIVLTSLLMVNADLSNETKDIVENLRLKNGWVAPLKFTSGTLIINMDNYIYDFMTISFKDDKLFVETQDGKWFIEMEKE